MKTMMLLFVVLFALSGCSGGSSGGGGTISSGTVSGTALYGAPISGIVALRDSKGSSRFSEIDVTTGGYSISVDGMTAPFILQAGPYYSIASSATTTNINSLTNFCTRAALGSTSLNNVYGDPAQYLAAVASRMPEIVADLNKSLDALYPPSVPVTQRDFMNGSLVIDQGVDLVFKNVSISSTYEYIKINYNLQILVTVNVTNNTATIISNPTTISTLANIINTAIGDTSTTTSFSTSDLAGTWNMIKFQAGSSPLWSHWVFTIGSDGVSQYTTTVTSSGAGYANAANFNITTSGIVTLEQDASYVSVMNSAKNLIIGTGTKNGSPLMIVLVKSERSFTSADLVGNWKANSLSQGTTTSWKRSDIAIDASGNMVSVNSVSSTGAIVGSSTSEISISNQGVVTNPNYSSDYGVMDSSKNNLFVVGSSSSGDLQLIIFTRTGNSNLSLTDMQGSWKTNILSLNNFYWARGISFFDESGNMTSTNRVQNNIALPDGSSSPFAITSGGIIGSPASNSTFSGVMALNKDLMVGTLTQDLTGTPSPSLFIWMK